jgi:hypothetical protein
MLAIAGSAATLASAAMPPCTIVCPTDASATLKLAAKEIRRYVYLRTGELLPIADSGTGAAAAITLKTDKALEAQQYRLKTNDKILTISGGSDVAVLYGVYDFSEKLGVRFYLHGDVIPDGKTTFAIPQLDETHKPLFDIRGIQPFHDFDEGPDWWDQDDYLAYVSQLAKMRMNFIGLHCYPQGGVGPEPAVWIGQGGDIGPKGTVKFSYPTMWGNTARDGMWGYKAMTTGEYAGGASLLFAGDVYGPAVMKGMMPQPQTPEQCNELFDRVGEMFRVVFTHAHHLGLKTCIGTETPLMIPTLVQQRLRKQGKNLRDPAVTGELYEGMFRRIAAAHPLDFYWLWTPEDWTWSDNNPQQFEATTRDIQAALGAIQSLGKPFTLATCGWVLGPAHDRAALDACLPKTSPMSCINRQVGHEGVEPAFANVTGRPKWAIPWMENDPNLVGLQLWAARMRYDAVDARRFGCTGLLGIHWRTKAIAPNLAALAAAAWDQSWVPANFGTTPVKPSRGGQGTLGGSAASFTAPIMSAGSTPMAVYQTVRYNLNGYNLAVPDGTYTVTLQFNEPHYAAVGKRVFGVKIQGRQVITNLDIFAKVGQNKALDVSFPGIAVTNGTLHIDFTKEVEFPCIAGIVIAGKTKASNQLASKSFMRKINCGGTAVADYEADRVNGGNAPASRDRAMPIEDFYIDFARANFGDSVAEPAGRILAKIDGIHLPQASDWKTGPGDVITISQPWEQVKARYAFVDELAAVRLQVKGAGNLQRFDYWLNTCRAMSAMAEAGCARGQLDKAVTEKHFQQALVARIELAKIWTRLLTLQTAIVSTPGELGTIANLEQHSRLQAHFVDGHDGALARALGKPLPAESTPGKDYTGPARLIVPTVRTHAAPGETLSLKIIALDKQPVKSVAVHVRPLGEGDWKTSASEHVGRAVYTAQLPAGRDDFEYFIEAQTSAGKTLRWPATAPEMNQTVVVNP